MRVRPWMIGVLAARGLWRRRRERDEDGKRIVRAGSPERRAELVVVALLLAAAAASVLFVVLYAIGAGTQALGGALAGALALVAAGLIVVGKRLVVEEELPEAYPEPQPEEQQAVRQIISESGSRLTRKKLLLGAAGTAGGALGAALVTPALSLGPVFEASSLYETPWRRGRRLVDSRGEPLRADDISTETFYTAYPEGAARDALGAPLVVVRVLEALLELPPERSGWAPQGILAFSKICTHAGCAVSLYRVPKFGPTQPRPALVCPCHYSTFEPQTGGRVLFGPAGRPLPQLPLSIDPDGVLVAAGRYSGAIGPSWSGVRQPPPE